MLFHANMYVHMYVIHAYILMYSSYNAELNVHAQVQVSTILVHLYILYECVLYMCVHTYLYTYPVCIYLTALIVVLHIYTYVYVCMYSIILQCCLFHLPTTPQHTHYTPHHTTPLHHTNNNTTGDTYTK